MAKIRKIEQTAPAIVPRKKVAAYARVSVESERMSHSLSAQVSYYSALIQRNPDWEYAGVYADYGISGTGTARRDEFRKMVEDADAGKIDIILTKSIQRFARNTVDLLETVRHLKGIGVEVRFEKEGISSMSGDGELMLTRTAGRRSTVPPHLRKGGNMERTLEARPASQVGLNVPSAGTITASRRGSGRTVKSTICFPAPPQTPVGTTASMRTTFRGFLPKPWGLMHSMHRLFLRRLIML